MFVSQFLAHRKASYTYEQKEEINFGTGGLFLVINFGRGGHAG